MRMLALAAAALAAVALPHAPLGVGVPLVALLVAAAVVVVARTRDMALFGGLALLLACMPALLDAGWVLAIDLVAACALAAVAVAGPRVVALVAPFRALAGLPELVPASPRSSVSTARGLAFGVVLVLPFGVLFWSADAAFAAFAESAPLPSAETMFGRALVFVLVLLGALGLALAARRVFADPELPGPLLGVAEWAIPLVLLNLLFLAFVGVQVTVLFGGHDHVLETAGLTYAEYARQGFWQLIAAALLTLVVVAAATRLARRPEDRAGCSERCSARSACSRWSSSRRPAPPLAVRGRVRADPPAAGGGDDSCGGRRALRPRPARGGASRRAWTASADRARRSRGRTDRLLALEPRRARSGEERRALARTGDLDVAYVQDLSADAVPALADPSRAAASSAFSRRFEHDSREPEP